MESARDPWLPDLRRLARPIARGCDGKRRYDDKRAAVSEANRQADSGRKTARNLRAYHCGRCGGWHLTHKNRDQ